MNAAGAKNRRVLRQSIVRVSLWVGIIVLGLALRRFGLGAGLPPLIVKYGGSILWGAMVFFLVAIAGPRRTRFHIALIAILIAVAFELFRLVHTPWLDDFRLTLAGALLFGRIFSPWDILAYGVGILSALLLDRLSLVEALVPHSPS